MSVEVNIEINNNIYLDLSSIPGISIAVREVFVKDNSNMHESGHKFNVRKCS
jgi:hypothetical protein